MDNAVSNAADWPEVNAWRKAQRTRLRAERLGLTPAQRRTAQRRVLAHLTAALPELRAAGAAPVAFYWPFRGEIDVQPLLRSHVEASGRAALPVVVQRNAPVEFWEWTPDTRLVPGLWDIPVPAERRPVAPALLLVPLLGFDAAGYRLGNGGGYYDRTLAVLHPRPVAVGVGHALGRLESVRPQPHDVPLDAIVTESGLRWSPLSASARAAPSSPVCYADEADPAYFGQLETEAVQALLRRLRGAALAELSRVGDSADGQADATAAIRAAIWAAQASALAARALAHLGAEPLGDAQPVAETLADVCAELRRALPRLADESLHAALAAWLDVDPVPRPLGLQSTARGG